LEDALIIIMGFIISFVFSSVIFVLGNKKKRYDKYPFLSGESLKVGKIQYSIKWVYYVFLLVALDAAIILIAVSSYYISIFAVLYLTLVSLILLFIPKTR